MKQLFLKNYHEGLINRAIEKAKKVPRKYALKYVERKTNNTRPIFATKYDPRMPLIQNIQNKHWRSMVKTDKYLSEVFKQPPITVFGKQKKT